MPLDPLIAIYAVRRRLHEHVCGILTSAHELGGARPLPAAEPEALRLQRGQSGGRLL